MSFFRAMPCLRAAAPAAVAMALTAWIPSTRANVYATDIKVNGILTGAAAAPTPARPAVISYRLNQQATLGCTVSILSGNTTIATIAGGTAMGLNKVAWGGTNQSGAPVGPGSYGISITAAAAAFANWTQISVDGNPGMSIQNLAGIDVDKNATSPWYGRVVASCSDDSGTANSIDGFYKMNADGSRADEGWYGSAGYAMDDGGDAGSVNQMPKSYGFNPLTLRIAEDDRIYWLDQSAAGAIVACDILATTNQVVIDEGSFASAVELNPVLQGPYNYQNCPDINYLTAGGGGIDQFDVNASGTNSAVYLVDSDVPGWGIWMFHLTNGTADPADTVGTQLLEVTNQFSAAGAGVALDYNLDVFVSQNPPAFSPKLYMTFLFSNWNDGILPPEGDGAARTYALPVAGLPNWETGRDDVGETGINDTVIDSRVNPTLVALPMMQGGATNGYLGQNGGIRLLNATNGSIVVANLDSSNWYSGAAFDAVGNVYGCSPSANLWRVWSPPGASTNTTTMVSPLTVVTPPVITGVTATSSGGGCSSVTINFTGSSAPGFSYAVYQSSSPNGPFSQAPGATIIGGSGAYQASLTCCSTTFFVIAYVP